MCENSIYVKNRQATGRENLALRQLPGHHNTNGFYPANPQAKDQKLVCIRQLKDMTVTRMQGIKSGHMSSGLPIGMANLAASLIRRRKIAATFVPAGATWLSSKGELPKHWNYSAYHDGIVMEGMRFPLWALQVGLQVRIGAAPKKRRRKVAKVTGKKGMLVLERAIKEATAVPKPKKAKAKKKARAKA